MSKVIGTLFICLQLNTLLFGMHVSNNSIDDDNIIDSGKITTNLPKFQKNRKNICNFVIAGNICGRICGSANALKSHLASHTGEKPFECKECKKAYSDYNVLRTHRCSKLKKKTGKIACDFPGCTKKLSTKIYAKQHYKTHFEQYQCAYCYKTYTMRSNCGFHIKNKHPDLESNIKVIKKSIANNSNFSDSAEEIVKTSTGEIENITNDEPLLIKIKRCLHCSKLFQASIFAHHQCVSKTMQLSNSNSNAAIPEQSDSIDLMEKMEFPSENNGFGTSNSGEKSFEFQFDSQMSSSHENEFNNQLSGMLTDKDYGLVPHVSGTGMSDKTPISQYEANSLSTVQNDMVGDLSQIIAQESSEVSPTCAGDAFADGFLRDDYDQLEVANSKKRKSDSEPDLTDREQAKRLKINGGNLDE